MNDDLLLADPRALRILALTQVPRCAREIAYAAGIPVVDVYRRINALRDRGYLSVAFVRHGHRGNSVRMWISTVSRVWISFMSGVPRMQVHARSEMIIELASERR